MQVYYQKSVHRGIFSIFTLHFNKIHKSLYNKFNIDSIEKLMIVENDNDISKLEKYVNELAKSNVNHLSTVDPN